MSFAIKEDFVGKEGLHIDWNISGKPVNVTEGYNVTEDPIDPNSIMVDIEGIHVGPTRNFTWYTKNALEGSIPTWTKPYCRPLIMHHNEKDGKIIGRVKHVSYTEVNTRSGSGALIFSANVPDKDGKEQIQDGRLKTVSIGAIVHEAYCTICGQNIAEEGKCEHELGFEYDGQICYWRIEKMEAKELSYVIVPSDPYAHNLKIYKPTFNKVKENIEKEVLSVSEAANQNPTVIEDGEKKPEVPVTPAQPAQPAEDYKKKYEELKIEKEKVDQELKDLKAEKETLDGTVKTVAKDLDDTKVLLNTANSNLQKAKDDLIIKESAFLQEKRLKEAAEQEIGTLKVQIKESTVDSIISIRESLGKPAIEKSELMAREDVYLTYAIKDLKEEMSSKTPGTISTIEQVKNPGVVETKESFGGTVKEEKSNSNISVEEEFKNIISAMMQPKF